MKTVSYHDVIMARVHKRRRLAKRERVWATFEAKVMAVAIGVSTALYLLGALFVVRALGMEVF